MITSFISDIAVLLKEFHVNVKNVDRKFSYYAYEIKSDRDNSIIKNHAFNFGRSDILKIILREAKLLHYIKKTTQR